MNKIDFTQLRIGNYVHFCYQPPYSSKKSNLCQILGRLRRYEALVQDLTRYNHTFMLLQQAGEFIDLTEEWLLKLGFEKTNKIYFGGLNPCFAKFSFALMVRHESYLFDWVGGITKIEYVHQLQNLYYFLTNEELFIKD